MVNKITPIKTISTPRKSRSKEMLSPISSTSPRVELEYSPREKTRNNPYDDNEADLTNVKEELNHSSLLGDKIGSKLEEIHDTVLVQKQSLDEFSTNYDVAIKTVQKHIDAVCEDINNLKEKVGKEIVLTNDEMIIEIEEKFREIEKCMRESKEKLNKDSEEEKVALVSQQEIEEKINEQLVRFNNLNKNKWAGELEKVHKVLSNVDGKYKEIETINENVSYLIEEEQKNKNQNNLMNERLTTLQSTLNNLIDKKNEMSTEITEIFKQKDIIITNIQKEVLNIKEWRTSLPNINELKEDTENLKNSRSIVNNLFLKVNKDLHANESHLQELEEKLNLTVSDFTNRLETITQSQMEQLKEIKYCSETNLDLDLKIKRLKLFERDISQLDSFIKEIKYDMNEETEKINGLASDNERLKESVDDLKFSFDSLIKEFRQMKIHIDKEFVISQLERKIVSTKFEALSSDTQKLNLRENENTNKIDILQRECKNLNEWKNGLPDINELEKSISICHNDIKQVNNEVNKDISNLKSNLEGIVDFQKEQQEVTFQHVTKELEAQTNRVQKIIEDQANLNERNFNNVEKSIEDLSNNIIETDKVLIAEISNIKDDLADHITNTANTHINTSDSLLKLQQQIEQLRLSSAEDHKNTCSDISNLIEWRFSLPNIFDIKEKTDILEQNNFNVENSIDNINNLIEKNFNISTELENCFKETNKKIELFPQQLQISKDETNQNLNELKASVKSIELKENQRHIEMLQDICNLKEEMSNRFVSSKEDNDMIISKLNLEIESLSKVTYEIKETSNISIGACRNDILVVKENLLDINKVITDCHNHIANNEKDLTEINSKSLVVDERLQNLENHLVVLEDLKQRKIEMKNQIDGQFEDMKSQINILQEKLNSICEANDLQSKETIDIKDKFSELDKKTKKYQSLFDSIQNKISSIKTDLNTNINFLNDKLTGLEKVTYTFSTQQEEQGQQAKDILYQILNLDKRLKNQETIRKEDAKKIKKNTKKIEKLKESENNNITELKNDLQKTNDLVKSNSLALNEKENQLKKEIVNSQKELQINLEKKQKEEIKANNQFHYWFILLGFIFFLTIYYYFAKTILHKCYLPSHPTF
ncbi:hypothetical protein ABK040_011011 [Willaertia magna]